MAKPKLDQEFLKENSIEKLVNSFASSTELYSVVLDINGKPLINPVGPAPYLGEFHEIALNPKFKTLYEDIVNCIADSKQAMYSEIDDGNPDSRFAAAPIFVNGRFYATWILYAHTKTQNQKLFKAFDHISTVAKVLSDIISACESGFGKHAPIEDVPKNRYIRQSLPFEPAILHPLPRSCIINQWSRRYFAFIYCF